MSQTARFLRALSKTWVIFQKSIAPYGHSENRFELLILHSLASSIRRPQPAVIYYLTSALTITEKEKLSPLLALGRVSIQKRNCTRCRVARNGFSISISISSVISVVWKMYWISLEICLFIWLSIYISYAYF